MADQMAERLARLTEAAKTTAEGAEDAREARNRAIAEADGAGMSITDIARATGLGRSYVHRLVIDQAAQNS